MDSDTKFRSMLDTPSQHSPRILQIRHQWPLIAVDIAMLNSPQMGETIDIHDIAKTYNLDEDEMCQLMANETFTQLVSEALKNTQTLGPRAGFMYRTEAMITEITEHLFLKAQANLLEPKDELKFLEHLLKSIGYDAPAESKNKDQPSMNNAVQVVVQIPADIDTPRFRELKKIAGNVEVIDG